MGKQLGRNLQLIVFGSLGPYAMEKSHQVKVAQIVH